MGERKYHTKTKSVDWYIRVNPDFWRVRDDKDKRLRMQDMAAGIIRHVDNVVSTQLIVETETRCVFCGCLFDPNGDCMRAKDPEGLEEGLPLCCEEHQEAWLTKREEDSGE